MTKHIDLSWEEATREVLKTSGKAMHYREIADQIVLQSLRRKYGATPATSVNVAIGNSLRDLGDRSPFVKVDVGRYMLREAGTSPSDSGTQTPEPEEDEAPGIIQAFGMYWQRNRVFWRKEPALRGEAQPGATPVDFSNQRGVYLLHDGREVVYVGRATDQSLGTRLFQHTIDRLSTRWDRFSWFGLHQVSQDGALKPPTSFQLSQGVIIATLEALLIEGLEPRQNRKRGDDFQAIEYLQMDDPEIKRQRKKALLDELGKDL